jgi:hypothetical protein
MPATVDSGLFLVQTSDVVGPIDARVSMGIAAVSAVDRNRLANHANVVERGSQTTWESRRCRIHDEELSRVTQTLSQPRRTLLHGRLLLATGRSVRRTLTVPRELAVRSASLGLLDRASLGV